MRIHTRCKDGLKVLREYHFKWDAEKKVFSKTPDHDWASHGADAFRYMASVFRMTEAFSRVRREDEAPMIRPATLNDQWEALERERSQMDRRI